MVLKAVFFDLDDTLVPTRDCDARAYQQVGALAKERLRSQINVVKLVEDFRTRFERSPWSPDINVDIDEWRGRLWTSALHGQAVENPAALGRELHEAFNRARLANFSFFPEVATVVDYLVANGIRVAIITNGHHQVQREKISACRAHLLFPDGEQIIVGGDEELEGRQQKPAAEIFHKACRVARCEPDEAIHVGDNLFTDVQVRLHFNLRKAKHDFRSVSSILITIYLLAGRHQCWTSCDCLDKPGASGDPRSSNTTDLHIELDSRTPQPYK